MAEKDPFPQRLKEARDLRGLNHAQLAERSKIPASSISHFEAGSRKPSFDSLRRLANALEVTTDFLLGRVDDVTASSSEGDQLFRNLQNLSTSDRDTLKLFVDTLSQREDARKKGEK